MIVSSWMNVWSLDLESSIYRSSISLCLIDRAHPFRHYSLICFCEAEEVEKTNAHKTQAFFYID